MRLHIPVFIGYLTESIEMKQQYFEEGSHKSGGDTEYHLSVQIAGIQELLIEFDRKK